MRAKYTGVAIVLLLCVQHNHAIFWGRTTHQVVLDLENLVTDINNKMRSHEDVESQMQRNMDTIGNRLNEIELSLSKINSYLPTEKSRCEELEARMETWFTANENKLSEIYDRALQTNALVKTTLPARIADILNEALDHAAKDTKESCHETAAKLNNETKKGITTIVDRQDFLHNRLLTNVTMLLGSQKVKPGESLADMLKNLENEVRKTNDEVHSYQSLKLHLEHDMKYFSEMVDEIKLSLSKMRQRGNLMSDQLMHVMKVLETQYGILPSD